MNLRPIFLILMLGCSAGTSVDQSGGLPPFLIGTWSPISPAPIDPRAAAVSHWTGSEMLVWGGEGENGSLGDGALYNPSNNTWRIMEPSGAPSDRTDLFNFRETWTGGANPELLIWSGRSASDYYYGGSTTFTNLFDGALYDYSSDTWSSIRSTTGDSDPDFLSYAGRAYLTGFYTGSEFIIWAGNNNITYPPGIISLDLPEGSAAYGSLYDPIGDNWRPMKNTPLVGNRKHSAVAWTGTDMIMWSGCFEPCTTHYFNIVGYNPTSDSWTNLSQLGSPAPRRLSFYVWTGTELIIWGGLGDRANDGDPNIALSDGGAYNPLSNIWRTISSEGAPSARANTTAALWTGSHFVVFGGMVPDGSGGYTFLNDGGMYNPVTDKWVRIPSTGLLPSSGIGKQQMVFTGDSILIWSGWNGSSTYPNKGAKFTLNPLYYR